VAIVSMGALAAQAKYVVDLMREEGYRVGAIKLRVFRPFPDDEIREVAKGLKALVVADRNISYGYKGISATELESALYSLEKRPLVLNFIMGIGGRDVKPEDQRKVIEAAFDLMETGELSKEAEWYGLLR
ncbi:MAG: transketolase C-terminal domain-containing protein, partial [Candidatus Baldrarchaeia archaeon]